MKLGKQALKEINEFSLSVLKPILLRYRERQHLAQRNKNKNDKIINIKYLPLLFVALIIFAIFNKASTYSIQICLTIIMPPY